MVEGQPSQYIAVLSTLKLKAERGMKVNRKLPEAIDLSILEFLEHGDRELIAKKDRELGYKTHRNYVVAVLKGRYRNSRILSAAFELALQRKNRFPLQVLKPLQA